MTASMIDQRLVTDRLLAVLRATTIPIGDGYAPEGADTMQRYGTLLHLNAGPPAPTPMVPERSYWLHYRVRSVGIDRSIVGGRTGPRWDAEAGATKFRRVLLDRRTKIEGTGWRIIRRRWLGSATESDGRTVNVIDDFEFEVAPRSA
jgi:hypothetical protein